MTKHSGKDAEGNPDPEPNDQWEPCGHTGCSKGKGHKDPHDANE
jgi:hypothetical protein